MKRAHAEPHEHEEQHVAPKKEKVGGRTGEVAAALSDLDFVSQLVEESVAYAVVHGIVYGKNAKERTVVHAPMALLPFELDATAFRRAQNMCPLFNKLVDRVSRKPQFLLTQLEGVGQADDFTGRLLRVLKTVEEMKGDKKQQLHLNINRSDYMIHAYEDEKGNVTSQVPQQVELNTIAASFGALSTKISQMHKFTFERYKGKANLSLAFLPENECVQEMAAAMAHAALLQGAPNGVVVCIVLPGETNIADQRILEYTLWDNHRVRMIRRTLLDIESRAKVRENGELSIDGESVAVVYFRAGYDPKHYTSEKEWDALLKIELSMAVKCPCTASHLAGCKKIQQLMAQPGMLEQFLTQKEADDLRCCFAGLWGLDKDDEDTRRVIADAIAHPQYYVLKPQREGGGNNLWNEEMTEKLKTASKAELSAYILMAQIKPRPATAPMMREGTLVIAECLSELGIFGALVSDDNNIFRNALCGHLLRTKKVGVDEGGVAAGFAVLSSPLLTDS